MRDTTVKITDNMISTEDSQLHYT